MNKYKNATKQSESLIGNLCNEIDLLRNRLPQLLHSINHCRDEVLRERLKKEFHLLVDRKNEVLKIALSWEENIFIDSLSNEFLIELCKRPLLYPEFDT